MKIIIRQNGETEVHELEGTTTLKEVLELFNKNPLKVGLFLKLKSPAGSFLVIGKSKFLASTIEFVA